MTQNEADETNIGQAFNGIRGKLYPAVSTNQSMIGAKLSAKFWRGSKDDYEFKAFDDPRTRRPPKGSGERDEDAAAEDGGVLELGDDGQGEIDIELEPEAPSPSLEVEKGPILDFRRMPTLTTFTTEGI